MIATFFQIGFGLALGLAAGAFLAALALCAIAALHRAIFGEKTMSEGERILRGRSR